MPDQPGGQRHGPVLPLTREELETLRDRHAPIPSPGCTVCKLLGMLEGREMERAELRRLRAERAEAAQAIREQLRETVAADAPLVILVRQLCKERERPEVEDAIAAARAACHA